MKTAVHPIKKDIVFDSLKEAHTRDHSQFQYHRKPAI